MSTHYPDLETSWLQR